jgi:hypothetical protein
MRTAEGVTTIAPASCGPNEGCAVLVGAGVAEHATKTSARPATMSRRPVYVTSSDFSALA